MPTSTIKNIIITNIVVLNGGDGAILFGMLKILRSVFGDNCRITVYASHPEIASVLYPEIEFRETLGLAATRCRFGEIRYLGRLCRAVQQIRYKCVTWLYSKRLRIFALLLPKPQRTSLKEYSRADLIVSSGGTYLKEEYGIRSQVMDYQLTLILKRPLVFFTQSMGPFTRRDTRALMQSVFEKSRIVLLRDQQSMNHLVDLDIAPTAIHQAADAAFALADTAHLAEAKYEPDPLNSKFRVAVSVRYWPHFATCSNEDGMTRYRMAVAEAVSQLIRDGADVSFISTCQGVTEYDDDSIEASRIIELLDKDIASEVHLVKDFVRFDEMMTCLKDYDLCIGTRMHMCILSLISGTPALPIAYEFKTTELFKSLGLEEWVTDIETMSPEIFSKRVVAFRQQIPCLRENLFDRVLAAYDSSLQAGNLISRSIKK